MKYLLSFIFIFASVLYGSEADDIIKAVEDNLRGDFMYAKMRMIVSNQRGTRTVEMESWSQGDTKSFIKILYPKQDRGITFLKLDTQMWQYIPKIERTIKIPPSMMLQSWMGSDFTNDDMVKESSIVKDYHARLIAKTASSATIELLPKADAAVVWGKIIVDVDLPNRVPMREIYYDDQMRQVRIMTFGDIQRHGSHVLPMVMELKPLDIEKKKNSTRVIFEKVNYDTPIDASYFSKHALKRYSN